MHPFFQKLTETLAYIRQENLPADAAADTPMRELVAWIEAMRPAEPDELAERCRQELPGLVNHWKAVFQHLGKGLTAEKQKWEEEKRRWLGFANPYGKKVAVYVEQTNRRLAALSVARLLPLSRLFLRSLGQECLAESCTGAKCLYTVPNACTAQLEDLANQEFKLYFGALQETVRRDIVLLRRQEFAPLALLSETSFDRVEFKIDYKGPCEFERDDDKYSETTRRPEPLRKAVFANLGKTLRAPALVLMTGAFLYSLLAGDSLRDLLRTVFQDYPISFWLFVIALIVYFVQLTRRDLAQKYRAGRLEERERIWNSCKNNLKSDFNTLTGTLKNDLKEFSAKIIEAEKEWLDAIREVYLQPFFEEKLNPLAQHLRHLTACDLELSRLSAELQRAALTMTHRTLHKTA